MIMNGFSLNKIVAGAILLVEHIQDFKDSYGHPWNPSSFESSTQ